jgi:4-hydroxy-tetrahydrodipicolinate synthase
MSIFSFTSGGSSKKPSASKSDAAPSGHDATSAQSGASGATGETGAPAPSAAPAMPPRPVLDEKATGLYAISATPFTEDGFVDFESARSLMDFYMACGASGITILGVMGEAPKLSGEERLEFYRTVLRHVAGKVPVVVGVTAAGLDNLALFARRVYDLGAAGVMAAPIPGLRTDEQIYSYFEQIAERLRDIPWVLQDYPQVTTVHMAPYLIVRMVHDFSNLVMFKHEDWPGLAKISALREAARLGGRRVSILVGNGGIHYPQELNRGVDGAMTGFAYPDALVATRSLYVAGKREDAEDIYDAYLPLIRHELQPGLGLAIRKHLLQRRGAIRHARLRAPGPKLDVLDIQEIEHLVRRMERRVRQLGIGQPIEFKR